MDEEDICHPRKRTTRQLYIDGSSYKIGASSYSGWGLWSPDESFNDHIRWVKAHLKQGKATATGVCFEVWFGNNEADIQAKKVLSSMDILLHKRARSWRKWI
eukprot:6003528-Heterocapsa_arctica.AAC.1